MPYRGIQPFRYADHEIFFARTRETRLLASLVDVYRGVFLYGNSGNGKSSLVNAGLLPAARELGFEPVRVRVQPRVGEELVIEQIVVSDDGAEVLPCVLAPEHTGSSRVVMSMVEFEQRVHAVADEHQPLLVFDQFEEILTLFDDADDATAGLRPALAEMIVRLLREALPVKLLFVFREDYLGRVKQLLSSRPELVDQALRLGAPSADALETIIRGPFERFPGRFERELEPALARRVRSALAERFGTGEVSLSEVQIVCLRLWRSSDPEALLAGNGVQGLLEDELGEALDAFPSDLRGAAVGLLSQMVTSAGTRNVISAEDLHQRVREEDPDIEPARLGEALERLERESKLVRRERRRDLYLYEITSEFLVPWISRRREELRLAHERQRERRRLRIFGSIAGALLIVAAAVAVLAIWALGQRADAQRRESEATSLALAASSAEPLSTRPDVSLALAFEAYRQSPRAETRSAVVRALIGARRSGLRGVLTGFTGRVSGVAFNPAGTVLASAGDDDTVRLWDPAARTELGRLRGHTAPVRAVAFSADGKTLASGGDDGEVRLWDPAADKPIARLGGHDGAVSALAFSPDGRFLAAGLAGPVRVWDAVTRRPLAALHGHKGMVRAVAFSPDGKTLASAGDDGDIRLWDPATGKRIDRLHHHRETISGVAFSPDGRTLAAAGGDGTVRLWDPARRKEVAVLGGHRGRVTGVAFSPDGRLLASSGVDGMVRVRDLATRKQVAVLSGHNGWVYGVAFSRDGRILASAGDDRTVRMWNAAPRRGLLTGHEGTVYDLAFSRDGKILASAGDDETVRVWDAATRRPLRVLRGQAGPVYGVALSPDGRTVASASFDGTVAMANVATDKQVTRLAGHQSTVYDVAFSRDGRTLASAGDDGTIRLWNPVTRKERGHIPGDHTPVKAVAFGPTGATLASAGDDGVVRLWSIATHKERSHLTIHAGGVVAFALSPDGRTVAITTADDATTVGLWNLGTGKQVARLAGHNGRVTALAFRPDGRVVASAGEDATVLWNLASRRQVVRLDGHKSTVASVAFSPDGKTLVTSGDDGTVRMWDEILWRSLNELHATVCDVLLAGLSRAEWALYAAGISYRRTCP
jgi:WD40 repeat protein